MSTTTTAAQQRPKQERTLFGVEWRRIAPTVKLDQSQETNIEVVNANNQNPNEKNEQQQEKSLDNIVYEQQQVQQSMNNLSLNNNSTASKKVVGFTDDDDGDDEAGDDVAMGDEEEEDENENESSTHDDNNNNNDNNNSGGQQAHINVNFILESPPSRYMHSMSLVNNQTELFIFGGYGTENMLKDVYIFNIEREEWRNVPFTIMNDKGEKSPSSNDDSSSTIGARYGHTSVTYRNKVYVFGGKSEMDGYSSDLLEFDISTCQCRSIVLRKSSNNSSESRLAGRALHSAIVDEKAGVMYVYGGSDDDTIYSELLKIDLNKFEWELVAPSSSSSQQPSARDQHAAILCENGTKMIIFGGISEDVLSDMWQYHIPSGEWSPVQSRALLSSFRPTERAGHVMCLCMDEVSKQETMIIVGGEDPNTAKYYDDIYAYSIGANEWVQMKQKSNFSAASHARSVAVNNKLFVFGGYSIASGPIDDFCVGTVKPIKRAPPATQQK